VTVGGTRAFAAFLMLLLGACVQVIPSPQGPKPVTTRPPVVTPSTSGSAALLGISTGPPVSRLGLSGANALAALSSFRESCPRLTSRADNSGLTRGEDWQVACQAAKSWTGGDAASFFAHHFETARIGDGKAYVTGYYEPEIAGVRARRPGYDVPVYAMPSDLVRAWPDDMPQAERKGTPPLGRYDQSGRFVAYYDRAEIENGALAGKGLEIAWAADPIELFFLQIQGSGRLRAPDGSVIRLGYAGQNGHSYTGIGGVMRERGLVGEGPGQYSGSMQGIMQYLREKPAEGRALMRENRSWIFFRELTGDAPVGALGVPVRGKASVAADPAFVPLGAPVWLTLDRKEANGLWIAQDTGGAIKGANRFDSFWGAGAEARSIAGGMSARGDAVLLLPKGTVSRLRSR